MKNSNSQTYIVATVKPWNIREFHETITNYPGKWHLITDPRKLTPERVQRIGPRYIFFPHWSWKVPSNILESAECVCFHETPLPYGRGGSPVQNMILRGWNKTVMSAIRMEEKLDSGPIYLQRTVSLAGSAQEIFERNARVVADMIHDMSRRRIHPRPQRGRSVIFRRRSPQQSDIARLEKPSPRRIYDLIRALDADTYPRAYLAIGSVRLEFSGAHRRRNSVTATVEIGMRK